jgi:hypothetical protein
MTYWHRTGTAKMGQDAMSVVDGTLKVHGIEHLRIADGSIMPRVTTGNTMVRRVVIGERAAKILLAERQSPTPSREASHIRALSATRGRQISPLRSLGAYSNRTSLKSIATISISVIGRRSGPRV